MNIKNDQRSDGNTGGTKTGIRSAAAKSQPTLTMIVTSDPDLPAAIAPAMRRLNTVMSQAETAKQAATLSRDITHDLILIDATLPRTQALDMIQANKEATNHIVLLASDDTPATLVVDAMRAGASDVVMRSDLRELTGRLRDLLHGSNEQAPASPEQLQTLCRRLNSVREDIGENVGGLCADLLGAYKGLSTQLDDVAMASELNSLLRQELDIESLLRTELEFLLARLGSMNAGVFLPGSDGEYSLGAYINYDLPRDATDLVLEELVDVIAPDFDQQRRVLHMPTEAERVERLGEGAHWLGDRSLLVVACHDEGSDEKEPECLAVIALFRKERAGFSDRDIRTLQIASDLFAQQLGRVIRTHHRHLPEDDWGQDLCDLDDLL